MNIRWHRFQNIFQHNYYSHIDPRHRVSLMRLLLILSPARIHDVLIHRFHGVSIHRFHDVLIHRFHDAKFHVHTSSSRVYDEGLDRHSGVLIHACCHAVAHVTVEKPIHGFIERIIKQNCCHRLLFFRVAELIRMTEIAGKVGSGRNVPQGW